MIIKRWSGSTWEAQSPKVTYTDIVHDVKAATPLSIFTNGKLKTSYLPDEVFGGLRYAGSITANGAGQDFIVNQSSDGLYPNWSSFQDFWAQSGPEGEFSGAFWIAAETVVLKDTDTNNPVKIFIDGLGSSQNLTTTSSFKMEPGDWLVFNGINLSGETGTATFYFSVVNNTYAFAVGDATANASTGGLITAADISKLYNIEANADVTDATNVQAAGALMDSELASETHVKALNQSVASGASPTFSTANMTDATNKRFMTDAQETKLDSVETNADVTDATNVTSALVAATTIGTSDKSTIRTNLGVDPAGTDNSTDVELAGSYDYITLSGQTITRHQIDWNTDISNKPSIPSAANNGLLDINDGVGISLTITGGDFTANKSTETEITVKMAYPVIINGGTAPAASYQIQDGALWFDLG